jgi:hypothetical protein
MSSAGFEPQILATYQTYALDGAATRIGKLSGSTKSKL